MFISNGEAKVPAQQNLVKNYRPIGRGAIAAAVAAIGKRKPKTANSNRPTGHRRPTSSVRGLPSCH